MVCADHRRIGRGAGSAKLVAVRLSQILYSQGFGSRRDCAALLARGAVSVAGGRVDDPHLDVPTEGLVFHVDGQSWTFHQPAVLMLHKPAGHECSRKPQHHPSVLQLLPLPLQRRGVQPVGRLDADTTGLLLLSDDGALIHRLTSPRHHVPKRYAVQTCDPVDAEQVRQLLQGVQLHDESALIRAAACTVKGTFELEMVLTEGKYHQVKRMLAAVGNRVRQLHRSHVGALVLPADLLPGRWRWLEADDLGLLEANS